MMVHTFFQFKDKIKYSVFSKCRLPITSAFVVFLMMILFASCEKAPESPKSPRIKNATKIVSPALNQQFSLNENIQFQIEAQSDTVSIAHISLMLGTDTLHFANTPDFTWQANTGTGIPGLKLAVTLTNGKVEILSPRITIVAPSEPEKYGYRLINTFPHDPDAYTQGLLYFKGELYESTGQRGESEMRLVEISSGKVLKKVNLADEHFGEGLTKYNDKLYQLTWTSNTCLVYDMATFDQITTFKYPTEGWGITTIHDKLLMSDGTEFLYYRDSDTFEEVGRLQVYDDKGAVKNLNELEYANGLIFANIYQTETIVAIDPLTGAVVGKVDLDGIFNKKNYSRKLDVLNGIAYNDDTKTYYVTGKYWPKLFEIEISMNNNL